jgi:hypothetical protein
MLAATVATGLLAGASLDQSIKQLPARHKIGLSNYSRYMRAADLGNGVPFLATLGIGAAGLTILTAINAFRHERRSRRARALYLAGALAVLHSLATLQAAPTAFRQRSVDPGDETTLAKILDRFERWQTIRVTLQILNLGVLVWALRESIRETPIQSSDAKQEHADYPAMK